MISMRSIYAFVMLTGVSSVAFAAPSLPKGINYRIEPLVGYETVYRSLPTPHTSTRTMYGARVIVGVEAISAELEYTKGSDTENYQSAPESVKNTDEKAKLGLRSTYNFNNYLFASGRAGAQATKNIREETNGGVVTRTEPPITYHPYAGANLGVRFGSIVSVSLGSTMVFKDNRDMSKNDVQNTVSVNFGF